MDAFNDALLEIFFADWMLLLSGQANSIKTLKVDHYITGNIKL